MAHRVKQKKEMSHQRKSLSDVKLFYFCKAMSSLAVARWEASYGHRVEQHSTFASRAIPNAPSRHNATLRGPLCILAPNHWPILCYKVGRICDAGLHLPPGHEQEAR
jgi:hypothetical protein